GAFIEKTLVAAGQAVKVDRRVRPEAAGLIGCGIMAGFGAAVNTGQVTRGDTVAVIGCGGVGDAAIAASAIAGARTVIAVDVDDTKLEWAKGFGATHTVNARQQDPVEAIQALTDGYGDCLPTRDFPMLIDLCLSGKLNLDGFVSETIGLDGVEDAFHKMERGEVLRSVVVL